MELNYQEQVSKVFNKLVDSSNIVLATSLDNHTTIRTMSHIVYDQKIAFQTSEELTKYQQILHNPRVALGLNNIQIEGVASIKGQPLDEEVFINKYKKAHPGSFNTYSHMGQSHVIEVQPTFITIWDYEEKEPYRIFIDLNKQTVSKKYYDYSK